MKAITPHCRHFSTAKQLKNLASSSPPKPEFPPLILNEDFCGKVLDQYPDIKSLKKLHSKIINDQNIRFNPSLAIKLMRAYAACGEPTATRHTPHIR
ncbi:hypothetical protein CRYUN_Cryun07bG0111800 [Craigia yunnanensis]